MLQYSKKSITQLCIYLYLGFIPCHRKYSQSGENKKTVVYSTVLYSTCQLRAAFIVIATVFSVASISHLSLVFSWYAHSPKTLCVYREIASWNYSVVHHSKALRKQYMPVLQNKKFEKTLCNGCGLTHILRLYTSQGLNHNTTWTIMLALWH